MSTDVAQERLAGTWSFVPVHSTATFSIKYLVNSYRGSFKELDATLENGQLSGSVKVASIAIDEENLAGHLQGPDFFDAERHPEISFASRELRVDGDDVVLEGELTMKGVTKPITAQGEIAGPTEDFMGNTRLGLALETTVDRTEFGVSWNADLPSGGKALADEVTLTVELEFNKA